MRLRDRRLRVYRVLPGYESWEVSRRQNGHLEVSLGSWVVTTEPGSSASTQSVVEEKPDNTDTELIDQVLNATRKSYMRCRAGRAIEDEYERGYAHAMDDIYRMITSNTVTESDSSNE